MPQFVVPHGREDDDAFFASLKAVYCVNLYVCYFRSAHSGEAGKKVGADMRVSGEETGEEGFLGFVGCNYADVVAP